jgi:signal transduction histidine kinase
VQSEKMSALGNLVAGVAHEINNPLGFINGNITEVRHCLDDITECLQSYRQTFPEPGEEIEALLEELEIDLLIEDLPQMLDSMKVGCDRIRGISNSLRMFSRADTESKFKANVHDGIDSTLLILKYRLKAKDFRPEIEVIRDYGNLPEINCFPGQLNQVFMNILANAIDMFDEIAEGRSFDQLQANPQRITIQTQVVEPHSIEIRIGDNGKGMSEEICSKIFDRKFTTKAVGKGTGLGLAIARQVIVEKHEGSLEVQSQIAQGTEFLIRLPI